MISVQAKKDFLQWFKNRHRLKRLECDWILNYLMANESTLENVSFTTNAKNYPRSMYMSTMNSIELPFMFYTPSRTTNDMKIAIDYIRLHRHEKLHIQLNYPDSHVCPMYANVLEDDPLDHEELSKESRLIAIPLIQAAEDKMFELEYDRLINAALDDRDLEGFMQLTEQFKKMGEEMK